MAQQPTTRTQVSGYRFLVRRMEHALIRRDVRMLHDPMRSQSRSLIVGVVFTVLAVAVCVVLAIFKPQDKIGTAKIIMGKDSGALYVVVGQTLHPVLNLASARLIIGESSNPAVVKELEISSMDRGSLVGIPGAPAAIPGPPAEEDFGWSVCDSISDSRAQTVTTSVIAGRLNQSDAAETMPQDQALLVAVGKSTYLVYEGKRALVDVNNPAVSRALRLDGVTPRPVSAGLLNAVPEAPAISPPVIANSGAAPTYPVSSARVGSIVEIERVGERQEYVVLTNGVQQVSEATADLIRFANSQGNDSILKVTPDALFGIPTVNDLAVQTFPTKAAKAVSADIAPVSCLAWLPGKGDDSAARMASVSIVIGRALPLPNGAKQVRLAQADDGGNNVDDAYIPTGKAPFVHITGILGDSNQLGPLFVILDTGVRFGVADAKTAEALGLGSRSVAAPWPIVELLAAGPALSRQAALISHDALPTDMNPAKLEIPKP
ncbi:MAG: type VII secretion protein EccB [Mycobacteriaceae bacterium]